MDIAILLQAVVSGILTGGILALIALGLTLVWGVMGILNVAHCDFLMLALFGGYLIVTGLDLHPYFSLLILAPLFFLLGMFVMRFAIRPVMEVSHVLPLLITVALMALFQNGTTAVLSQLMPVRYLSIDPKFWMGTFAVGDIVISQSRLVAFIGSIVVAVSLYWFIRNTDMGRAIRAYSENSKAASLMGINVGRMQLITFGIGIACAASAAPFMLPTYPIDPKIGLVFIVPIFAIVVMGGLGNFVGTLLAGLIIGFVEGVAGVFLTGALVPAVSLTILVLVLLFRPEGMFK